jgi:glycosyltransferase involved in cell wall biosynthesis
MRSICLVAQSVYDFDPRVRRKAEALIGAGYAVDVLSLRPEGGEPSYTVAGVNVRTMPLGKKRGSHFRYLFEYVAFFFWAAYRLAVQMRTRRYAVVDVNTLPDFLIFAAAPARWMGAKLILDMHEITPEFYMSKYGMTRDSWVVRALTIIERLSFSYADRVLTINEPIQELLVGRRLPRGKSIVLMNAADESRFATSDVSPAADGAPDRFVMMYHGTLTKIYGLDLAIEAFARAHHEMPGAELWILGSGSELQALADLARQHDVASKVRLPGQVPTTDIPGWLSQCDLGLLPIRRDVFLDFAFPNKLSEFIIAGRPVLVSRLEAIRHYFDDEALAFFEPNEPADLARQMQKVYRDRSLRDRLVAHATRQYAPIRWEVMKQRYLELIDRTILATRDVTNQRHDTTFAPIGRKRTLP